MLELDTSTEETSIEQSTDTSSVDSTENTDSGVDSEASAEEKLQAIIDLDKAEKFRFKGREWTPADLQKSIMLNKDYTTKTQALSQERKYYSNLAADLENVRKNPSLAVRFREVYPENFHGFLKYALSNQASKSTNREGVESGEGQAEKSSIEIERLERLEQKLHEQEVEKYMSILDAKFAKLSQKYPYAREKDVSAWAAAMLDPKNPNKQAVTDETYEELFKRSQDEMEEFFKQRQKQLNDAALKANAKAKDSPKGGGIQGQAPKTPRNLKEAKEALLAEFSS